MGTTAQSEIAKKKDSEIARLRKEIDEATAAGEDAVSALKGKMAAAVQEAQDETEAVKKAKAKSDKDKAAVAAELADATADISTLKKQKQSADKAYRVLEDQLLDLKGRYEEQEIALVDVEAKAAKAASDGSNTGKALEEAEHKIGLLTKDKKSLEQALDEVRGEAEAESKAKHDTNLKLKAAQSEIEALNEQLEEEASTKAVMQQKLSKALADAASGKGGFGIEDSERVEELEDAKKKLNARVKEMEEALMAAETKAAGMEKVKNRMNEEVEDLLLELFPWDVSRPVPSRPVWSSPSPQLPSPLKSNPSKCIIPQLKRLCPETTLDSTSRTSPSRTSSVVWLPPTANQTPPKKPKASLLRSLS